MIQIKDLRFRYRPEQLVLDLPELNVAASEKVFLFGPSGSGKSTLLEILAGVQVPQSGTLIIGETTVTNLSPTQKDQFRAKNIGYIFQSFNLIPYLSVTENIMLPLVFNSRSSGEQFASRCDELCETLGIADLKNRKATDLSVGQQQRVAAARAMLLKPKLILADEPTSALDFDHREKFLQVIFRLCQENGSTLVFVSHDRSIAQMFDRQLNLLELNRAKGSGK